MKTMYLVKKKLMLLKEIIINKFNNMYKIRGKITNVENLDINTTKGDFVKKLITIEELDTDFSNLMQFEIFGEEKINVIEHSQKLKEGKIVNIDFYVKSREYKGKFYNTLMIKEARVEETATRLSEEALPFENKNPF